MEPKRSPAQLDTDIASVLTRMGELLYKYSFSAFIWADYGKYGTATEFIRKWIIPQAENTYNSYVKILAQLNGEKIQR